MGERSLFESLSTQTSLHFTALIVINTARSLLNNTNLNIDRKELSAQTTDLAVFLVRTA